MDEFMKSLPGENVQYLATLQQTQGLFGPFTIAYAHLLTSQKLLTSSFTSVKASAQTIHPLSCSMKSFLPNETVENHPSFTKQRPTSCPIQQITFGVQHLLIHQIHASRATIVPLSVEVSLSNPVMRYPSDIEAVPAKLDPTLMKEPRVIQGVPRIPIAKARRKPIPSMLGPNSSASPPKIRTS